MHGPVKMRNFAAVKMVGGLVLTLIYLWPLWIGLSSYPGLLYMERGNVQEVRLAASILMVVFGLPISFACHLALSLLVEQSVVIRFLLNNESPIAFVAVWVIFFFVGMFQWLVLVPIIVRRVGRLRS